MSTIGYGYGSEWHLLRFLGYHRGALNAAIEKTTGGKMVDWLDFGSDARRKFLDAEWKGIDFLKPGATLKKAWAAFWPQTGNVPNWDAVGRLRVGGDDDWLLVEAKAHLGEIKSSCGAKGPAKGGGREVIRSALDGTKAALGVDPARDWLRGYYQYANRLAVLHFLASRGVHARLLFIYFCGDRRAKGSAICPKTAVEWQRELKAMHQHLGLTGRSQLEKRVSQAFLPVCP